MNPIAIPMPFLTHVNIVTPLLTYYCDPEWVDTPLLAVLSWTSPPPRLPGKEYISI
jgi:hypothetical protein